MKVDLALNKETEPKYNGTHRENRVYVHSIRSKELVYLFPQKLQQMQEA